VLAGGAHAEAFTHPCTNRSPPPPGSASAGLRLGDHRVHALLQALLGPPASRDRVSATAICAAWSPGYSAHPTQSAPTKPATTYAGTPPTGSSPASPQTHRYRLSDIGGEHAMLLTHIHSRLLRTRPRQLFDPGPPAPSRLRTAPRTTNGPRRPHPASRTRITKTRLDLADFADPSFASATPAPDRRRGPVGPATARILQR
jgi:hypothetical protein